MEKHYDVGILGVWFGCNYGSIATYYALEKTIESFGLKVLMVHRPRLEADDGRMKGRHSIRFAEENYEISKSYHVSEIGELNELCDAFVLGSDQLWNYGVTKIFGHSYFLDFAAPDKKKIAYATSFGGSQFLAPWSFTREAARCMRRMDAVSVREADGVKLCRDLFGVKAAHVLDPVLMSDPGILSELAEKSERREDAPYIATYILDPTPEKREALLYVSEKLDKKLVNMLDGWYNKFPANKKKLNLENTIEKLQVEEWLCYFKYSDFVITDSFHGTCMAILFQKPFIAIGNPGRGTSRFESLLGSLNLTHRFVERPEKIPEDSSLLEELDYTEVNRILEKERETSRNWLREALFGETGKNDPPLSWKIQGMLGRMKFCASYYLRAAGRKVLGKIRKD
ncbi:MAG: polysaccharide pyruvyl transferase family protein [Candidatus Limivivens sp.]|nr:polysaccharide pyruvyl transferase family protein [Candidatus Limivivens sp.]